MRRDRGQTTAEYAIVLGVVVAALVAMQVYVKRGVNAQVRSGVDQFTQAGTTNLTWMSDPRLRQGEVKLDRTTATATGQYEPYYAESKSQTLRDSQQEDDINLAAGSIRRDVKGSASADETTTRKVGAYQKQRSISEAD